MAAVKRFPARTIVLMVLAVLSFAWFWYQTHRAGQRSARSNLPITDVHIVAGDGGG